MTFSSRASLLAAVLIAAPAWAQNPWGEVKAPSAGEAEAIGGYAAGCVAGAAALPLSGAGFQVMRSSRNRYYGHPALVAFVERLADRAQFVAGGEEGHAQPAQHRHLGLAERGQQAQIGRPDDAAGAQRGTAARQVFARQAPVVTAAHRAGGDAHGSAFDPRELLRHDGVEAGRHHGASHDAQAVARRHRSIEGLASEAGAGDREHGVAVCDEGGAMFRHALVDLDILVGDALQTLAFQVLCGDADDGGTPATRLAMIRTLAAASGSRGMAGGQALDLDAVGRDLSLAELEQLHIHKTGALIRASVRLGTLAAPDADPGAVRSLDRYGKCIGLAFQIRDDILDVEGDPALIGKTRGKDAAHNKPTYPALLGLAGAREKCAALLAEATDCLEGLGERAQPLRWLAEYIVARSH